MLWQSLLRTYRRRLAGFFLFRLGKASVLAGWRGVYSAVAGIRRHPQSGRYRWLALSQAGQECLARVPVAPEERMAIPPATFTGHAANEIPAHLSVTEMLAPAVELYEFADAFAVGGMDFLFRGDSCIHHDLFVPLQHSCPAENVGVVAVDRIRHGLRLRLLRPGFEVDKAVSLIGQCSGNYAHWLTETLPKLAVLEAGGHYSDYPLLVDSGLHPNILASVDSLNRHRRDVIPVPRWTPVHAGRLVAVSAPGYERYAAHGLANREPAPYVNRFSAAALGELRALMAATFGQAGRTGGKRVYFARASHSGNVRQIVNRVEIEQVLAAHGVERLRPDRMTFPEQVRACIDAELIVGPIGASLANMIFAPPGCRVVVLSPYYDGASYHFYANLAGALGHRIHFVLGKQTSSRRHPMHRDYRIDATALALALRGDQA